MMQAMNKLTLGLAAALLALGSVASAADVPPMDAAALVQALRKGGCYIVMRHASSPREVPSAAEAVSGNSPLERQLDAKGRETARAMGEALRRLRIPVTAVVSSPTWRARETAMEAKFPMPSLVAELGDGGQSMAAAGTNQANWLKQRVAQPVAGGNTVVITHFPNLRAAFPEAAVDVTDGEALIFAPDGKGAARLLRRVRIEEWTSMADRT